MQKLILKVATATLLVLASITGSISFQHAQTAPGAERVTTSSSFSPLLSNADISVVAEFDRVAFADQTLNDVSYISTSPADLIAAGACAALVGCCILGFVLLRKRFHGAPGSTWTTVFRRTVSVAFLPAPVISPRSPSLTLLSISRI